MTIKRVAMNECHLDDAFALTQQLQWPHRHTDWQQMLLSGEGLVALENGTPVGSRLCWRWGAITPSSVCFVDARCRGAYRSLLLRATLGRSGERRVGLHVTAAVV